MRRACLEQIGRLDEQFFIYDEDIDWCRRARTAGWKIRFWPGASMVHVGRLGASLHEGQDLRASAAISHIRKHHSSLPATLCYLVMVGRLTLATSWQAMRWLGGAASLAEVRERSSRQMQFALLRPGRTGG
jgi:GT2 family glycosyltransferase